VRPRLVTNAFAVLVGATFAVFASFGILVLALPLYVRDELAGSDLAVGIAVGAASIGAIIAGPPSGRLADRVGRRVVLLASAAVMAGGYLFLALEPPLAAIVPARVVAGAAEAGFVVAGFTMAADLAPADRRGESASLVTVGSYAGLAVGPVVGNSLVEAGRFSAVWVVAALCVVVAGLASFSLSETRPDEEAPHGWLPPRPALLPGVILFLALLGFGGFNAFAALHARDVGLDRPGLVFAVFGGTVVLVRLVGRKLPDRLGARTAASAACATIACGLVILATWPAKAGVLVGTAVFALGQALSYPAIVLLAMARADPAERSAAVGAVVAFVDVALAAGAFVLSVAADAAGYGAVFLAGAVSAAIGLLFLMRTSVGSASAVEQA
jgi:predicted MFS family arabinose efflux permease